MTHEVFFTLVAPDNVSQDMEDITQGLVQTLKEVEAGQGFCQHETGGCPSMDLNHRIIE